MASTPAFNVRVTPDGRVCQVVKGGLKPLPEAVVAAIRGRLEQAENRAGHFYVFGEKGVAVLDPQAYATLKG